MCHLFGASNGVEFSRSLNAIKVIKINYGVIPALTKRASQIMKWSGVKYPNGKSY